MRHGFCHWHGMRFEGWGRWPGREWRLVEPAVLFLIATGQATHGYELIAQANELYLTDSVIDPAAIYRVLRDLEAQGCVESTWDVEGPGPARRVYRITERGRDRLVQWVTAIERRARRMLEFVERYRASSAGGGTPSA